MSKNKKDVYMEDLSKDELEALRRSSGRKVTNLFDRLNSKFQEQVEGFNKALQAIDKKYKEMYGFLVRELIAKMENRVYSNELYSTASLDLILKKLYYIEKSIFDSTNSGNKFVEFNTWLKENTDHHYSIMMDLKNKMVEAMKEENNDGK